MVKKNNIHQFRLKIALLKFISLSGSKCGDVLKSKYFSTLK